MTDPFGSSRQTVPSWALATQTATPAATEVGASPAGIVAAIRFAPGSSFWTVSSAAPVTHTAPAPAAIALGRQQSEIASARTSPVVGSILVTVFDAAFATHTAPSPAATAAGRLPGARSIIPST